MSRSLLKLLGILLLAAGIGYTVALIMVLVVSQQDQRRPADAIVVLGAAQYNGRPSPVLKARLDHALELYRGGLASVIVFTGGIGENSGWLRREACRGLECLGVHVDEERNGVTYVRTTH